MAVSKKRAATKVNLAGRGSAKLSQAAGTIKKKLKGVKIIDWHEVGQPGPDVIFGTVQANIGNFRSHVATLTKLKELRDLNILIHGQPPRPEVVQVNFTLGRG